MYLYGIFSVVSRFICKIIVQVKYIFLNKYYKHNNRRGIISHVSGRIVVISYSPKRTNILRFNSSSSSLSLYYPSSLSSLLSFPSSFSSSPSSSPQSSSSSSSLYNYLSLSNSSLDSFLPILLLIRRCNIKQFQSPLIPLLQDDSRTLPSRVLHLPLHFLWVGAAVRKRGRR